MSGLGVNRTALPRRPKVQEQAAALPCQEGEDFYPAPLQIEPLHLFLSFRRDPRYWFG